MSTILDELLSEEQRFRTRPQLTDFLESQQRKDETKAAYFRRLLEELRLKHYTITNPITPEKIACIRAQLNLEETKKK